jgi:hypothetical protein
MNLLDELAGMDFADHTESKKIVPGRVAHIDADFMAYIIAADTVAEQRGEKPMRDIGYKYGQVHDFAEYIRGQAGAERYVLHITPQGSNKGNRAAQAVQQEYQANRQGKEPPADLHRVRDYIAGMVGRVAVHLDQEADDGLAQANYNDPSNAILCSRDKDLRMVPGLHLDMDTAEIIDVPFRDFGKLVIDDSKSSKKVVGYGPAFFFAQCVMGDAADNIKGLPLAPARAVMKVKPTATFTKDLERYQAAVAKGQTHNIDFAKDRLQSHLVTAKQCGPALTYELLKDITNVYDAFQYVLSLYEGLAAEHGYQFVHWRTGEPVTPKQVLLGEMQLLWMRRNKNPLDVIEFIKENKK